MNFFLRIYVLLALNVAAQHTKILIVTLDLTPDISKQSTLHVRFIIFSRLKVDVNRSHEIYYSFDSH